MAKLIFHAGEVFAGRRPLAAQGLEPHGRLAATLTGVACVLAGCPQRLVSPGLGLGQRLPRLAKHGQRSLGGGRRREAGCKLRRLRLTA